MPEKPYVIGIAGGSGSGKTYFRNCFLSHFQANAVALLSQDDYYLPPPRQLSRAENMAYNFDEPESIDHQQFLTDIRRLINGETVYKQEYTFNNPKAEARMLRILPAPVIIVEGLFILHNPEIAALLDLRLFLLADPRTALSRRLRRDFAERGYSAEEATYKWINHVLPAYAKYLEPYQSECDEVIVNDRDEPEIVRSAAAAIAAKLKGHQR